MKHTLYKLTDAKDQTYGGMQWGPNVTHSISMGIRLHAFFSSPASYEHSGLCSGYWIHAYPSPQLAWLLDVAGYLSTGAGYLSTGIGGLLAVQPPGHLWECIGWGHYRAEDTKCGVTRLTTVRRLHCPAWDFNLWNQRQKRISPSVLYGDIDHAVVEAAEVLKDMDFSPIVEVQP